MENLYSEYPVVLSIAGSDNTGGAGIQADIKTCQACGVYCTTAVTAVTSQNARGLRMAAYVGTELLESQLETIFECFRPDAVKIGMLPCAEAVERVCATLRKHDACGNIVIDPVLTATAGGSLGSGQDTIDAMTTLLFPRATLVTPNLPELAQLSRLPEAEPETAAHRLSETFGVENILVKGGHGAGATSRDLLIRKGKKTLQFDSPRINSAHTHGTGCTLSSAIAAYLAMGMNIEMSVGKAKQFITSAIERGQRYIVTETYGPVQQSALMKKL